MYEIHTGTPENHHTHHRVKYPFGQLAVGTYFEVPADDPAAQPKARSRAAPVQHAAHSYGRLHDIRFRTVRTETGAVRVYRVK
jgi:hypothetical protein